MNPIVQLYWIRVAIAVFAAALSALLALLSGPAAETSTSTLLNCILLAIVVYLASYYILRVKFRKIIEQQSKIMSTAIAMYFFTWLACFVLFYTLAKSF